MSTYERDRAQRKQYADTNQSPHASQRARRMAALERTMMALEDACAEILAIRFVHSDADIDRMTWQQHFKNIVTPVSLALSEYRGPRRFHYHYRHRADDASVLQPVFEPDPVDMLAQVCAYALGECQRKLVGIRDADIVRHKRALETALATFLMHHKLMKEKTRQPETA